MFILSWTNEPRGNKSYSVPWRRNKYGDLFTARSIKTASEASVKWINWPNGLFASAQFKAPRRNCPGENSVRDRMCYTWYVRDGARLTPSAPVSEERMVTFNWRSQLPEDIVHKYATFTPNKIIIKQGIAIITIPSSGVSRRKSFPYNDTTVPHSVSCNVFGLKFYIRISLVHHVIINSPCHH